ncbi:MAG: BACON domain-containing protein [Fretibacterium sp.]|nr:BACON domain-containing protein [Fretibacterium sp.]
MRQRFFYLWIVAAMAFVAFSGGCGGGSSSPSSRPRGDMTSYLEEALSRDVDLNSLSRGDIVLLVIDEGLDAPEEKKRAVKNAFERGVLLTLAYASSGEINTLRQVLGLAPNFSIPEDWTDPWVEVYAITSRTRDGVRDIYTYVTPSDSNFAGETASTDVTQECVEKGLLELKSGDAPVPDGNELETVPEEMTEEQYHRSRVKNLLKWKEEGLNSLEQQVAASARSLTVRLAEDASDLKKLASAQVETRDCSGEWFSSIVNYTIFTCHSFSDGSDYYLVQLGGNLAPKKYEHKTVKGTWESHYYAGYYEFSSLLDSGDMDASAVTLVKNAPPNANNSETVTNGFNWNIGGQVSYGQKDDLAFSGNGGITVESSSSTVINDYNIENTSTQGGYKAGTKWVYRFRRPPDGTLNFVGRNVQDAVNASRYTFTPDLQWIWQVSKSYWQQHPVVRLNTTYTPATGFSKGNGGALWISGGRTDYDTRRDSHSIAVSLTPPPHIGVSRGTFAFDRGAGSDTFTLLSEANWTASSDQAWCHINKTEGAGTGNSEVQVLVEVDHNDTGASRTAHITVSDGSNASTIEVVQSRY